MFNMFPLMVIPVIIYVIIAYTVGGADQASMVVTLNGPVFHIPMSTGQWALPLGDLIVILGMLGLFVEQIKAAGSGTSTIINHGLSMVVFVVAMALFLLVGKFGTSAFFLLTLMALMDTVGGFVVTVVAARRDLAVGGEG
ncbi:hypothetical protein [uncultured Maricaulis sp.]|uniref:hypothetical protein n=1 Tax=uncultured Maricaulis sp. TaxID=174710 RepID=UPI0030DDB9B1